jgi:hypothetical protein
MRRTGKCFEWLAESAKHLPHYELPPMLLTISKSGVDNSTQHEGTGEIKKMYNNSPDSKNAFTLIRILLAAALVLTSASTLTANAWGQTVTPPPTPTQITPPVGQSAFLVGHAFGTQGYTCLPTSTGATSWAVNPARPEATLFSDVFGHLVQITTHFTSINENPVDKKPPSLAGNATWQGFDTSRVWAKATGNLPAGSDLASCPNSGAIPCLLLESIGNQKGPSGGRLLADTTFVQRLNTSGGAAPTSVCTVGQTQLVPYTADYYFYRKAE